MFEQNTVIRKIGNSKGVILDARELKLRDLDEDSKVVIKYQKNKIVIEKED